MSNYFKNCYALSSVDEPLISSNEEDVSTVLDKVLFDSLCPINDLTGLREQPLTRVLDPNVSDSERNSLLSYLQKTDFKDEFANVDDATKLTLVKLRSLQTPSEVSAFTSALSRWIEENNIKVDTSSLEGNSTEGNSTEGNSTEGTSTEGTSTVTT